MTQAQAIYLIQTSDIQSQQYRVVSVAEGNDGTVGVTAVAYNESTWRKCRTGHCTDDTRHQQSKHYTKRTGKPVWYWCFLYQEGQTVHTGFTGAGSMTGLMSTSSVLNTSSTMTTSLS